MRNKYLLCTISGFLLALAWPTYGFPILIFIAFVPLLWVEEQLRTSRAKRKGVKVFLFTYLAFLIWNTFTTWWIWNSTPFGALFAILVNSWLLSVVFWVYYKVRKRLPDRVGWIFLPTIWISFEKFHLNWDFSWPWLNLGNVFSEQLGWIQWYEYTGSFGGSLWVWIVNISVFLALRHYVRTREIRSTIRRVAKSVLYIALPIIVSLFIWRGYEEKGDRVEVIVLQPNVDPYTEKYDRANADVLQDLLSMVERQITEDTRFVIAPETVFAEGAGIPLDEFPRSGLSRGIRKELQPYPDLNFLAGTQFYKLYRSKKEKTVTSNRIDQNVWVDIYNSAFLINGDTPPQIYHKSKLVVGVETMPFKSTLEPILGNVMLDLGGTVSTRATQKERGVLSSSDGLYHAAPIICYESVYGEFVTEYVNEGANFLAIITNDGWWGNTEGHRQHLSYASLRAIETRRAIARSANTGISAMIDARGEAMQFLDYGEKGALKGFIDLHEELTFYVRYGDYVARISIFIALVLILYAIAKRIKGTS